MPNRLSAAARWRLVIVLGHRGARAVAPENTRRAFERALRDGAWGSELDVRRTVDGALVCVHDAEILIDGGPRRVCDAAVADVVAVGGDDPPALLEEALGVLRGSLAVVEIKNHPWDPCFDASLSIADDVAAIVPAGTVVACFDPATLARAKERGSGLRSALITGASFDPRSNLEAAVAGGHEICSVEHTVIEASFVRDSHGAGREVWAWATDDPDRVRALAALGVDALICDDPARAVRALA